MNKLSVGQRLAAMAGVPLIIIMLLVIYSLSSFSKINISIDRIYDDRLIPLAQLTSVNEGYTQIINAINKADNGFKRPDKALAELRAGQEIIQSNWASYTRSKLNDDERKIVATAKTMLADANTNIVEAAGILAAMGSTLAFDEYGETLITDYNGDLFEYTDPIAEQISALMGLQLRIAQQEREDAQNIFDNAFNLLITLGAASLIVLAGSGMVIGRSISKPLNDLKSLIQEVDNNQDLTVKININQKDEIGEVATALQHMVNRFNQILGDVRDTSFQIQDSANSLSSNAEITREGVKVQTRETDQVATATTQMTHAIEEVSRNASQAASAANDANRETIDGNEVIEQTISSINSLADRINASSEVINRVEIDSSAIGTVLDVIRGIAEQTNLLALNAAIEAARAGEQGRGFAVVADEVRSLAKRTAESTQEIQQMIERLQAGSQEAVKSMSDGTEEMTRTLDRAAKAGESLAAIAKAVELINEMNTQIATATDQQKTVSQEISHNVVNISDVAKSSEHSFSEIDQASAQLKDVSNHLASLVNEFKTQ
ncbi:MAG: methyl-accepting chemotaxis protein [Pseudohongiellaceae bacterium]|jgi:methyl-accepting chemotaxis protein